MCLLTGDWQGRVRCGRRQASTTTSARNCSTLTTASTTDKGPEQLLRCVSPAKSNLSTYRRRQPSSPAATDDDGRRRLHRRTRDQARTFTVDRCRPQSPGRSCTTQSTAAARASTRAMSNIFTKVRHACVKTWTVKAVPVTTAFSTLRSTQNVQLVEETDRNRYRQAVAAYTVSPVSYTHLTLPTKRIV